MYGRAVTRACLAQRPPPAPHKRKEWMTGSNHTHIHNSGCSTPLIIDELHTTSRANMQPPARAPASTPCSSPTPGVNPQATQHSRTHPSVSPAFKPSCWPAIFFPPPAPVQQTSTKTADCRPVFLSCNNYETRPARMVTGSELAQSQHTHTDTESPHSPSPNTHALPTHCTTCHPAPALNVTFYCPRTLLVYA